MSILGGALYNYWALPLVCSLVATGATICYAISAALGPALLMNSESWRAKVEAWTDRIASHGDNLIPYLIVLRIAPLPPHWVVNVLAPHLGISLWVFWISTFLGIGGVSYIHVTIGTTLDQMASSDDFHIISIQNGVGLGGIIVAVLVPVLIKRHYKKDIDDAAYVFFAVFLICCSSKCSLTELTPPSPLQRRGRRRHGRAQHGPPFGPVRAPAHARQRPARAPARLGRGGRRVQAVVGRHAGRAERVQRGGAGEGGGRKSEQDAEVVGREGPEEHPVNKLNRGRVSSPLGVR